MTNASVFLPGRDKAGIGVVSGSFINGRTVPEPMRSRIPNFENGDSYSMNPNTGRQTPAPMPGLSKRAQEMLKPRKNQIVITPKSQADKTRSIVKGGI